MPVSNLVERVRTDLCAVLEMRAAPEDVIEFEATLTLAEFEGDDECPEHAGTTSRESAIQIFVSLSCPELGAHTRSMCHVTVPVAMLTDTEDVTDVGNSLWERLQANRLMIGLEGDMPDDLPGE